MSCWQILGISPTHDKQAIKLAYEHSLTVLEHGSGEHDAQALNLAYIEALEAADEEQVLDHLLMNDNSPPELSSSPTQPVAALEPAKQASASWHSHARVAVFFALIIGVFAYGFSEIEKPQPDELTSEQDQERQQAISVCGPLTTAEPVPELESCETFGNEGYIDVQKKLGWLYSQDGEHQDWQKAFEWFKKAGRYDRDARLLSQILLFVLGTDEENIINGEKGIKALSDKGFALAEAYLATTYFLDKNTLKRNVNPLWLLEKARNKDPSLVNPFRMALIYANGFGGHASPDKALNLLKEYADSDFPDSTNNVAWFLATLKDNNISQPDLAISLAQSVVQDERYANRYSYVDTLAAAHAAKGDFDQALAIQQKAISLLPEAELEEEDRIRDEEDFQQRLEKYKQQQQEIITHISVDREDIFKRIKSDLEDRLMVAMSNALPSSNIQGLDAE